ncbi:ABC transporter permease [Gemmatimonadota bacterium]
MRRRPGSAVLDLLLLIILLGGAIAALLGADLFPSELAGSALPEATPPSARHIFGTDALGRDMLARLLEGMRTTMAIGIGATILAIMMGSIYGGIAGLAGSRTDEVMMRGVDVGFSLPYMFLVILLVSLAGERSLLLLFMALGLVEWLPLSRVVRAGVRNLRGEAFIEASRMMGAGRLYVLRSHLFPNLGGPLVVYATLMLPVVMMQEAFLSFLGLGVAPPMASWGTLVADGVARMETAPWILLTAGLSLAVWLVSLHLAGDRLARRLNVHRTTGAVDRVMRADYHADEEISRLGECER